MVRPAKSSSGVKTPHSSTDVLERTTKPFDEYLDLTTWRMKPVSDAYLERLALELTTWALNDDEALKITLFFNKRGITSDVIARWKLRDEKFARAYNLSLAVIGDRREIGALKRKYDAGIVSSSMSHYDPVWKELAEFRSSLSKENSDNRTQVVVIEKFPDSPLVPTKLVPNKKE